MYGTVFLIFFPRKKQFLPQNVAVLKILKIFCLSCWQISLLLFILMIICAQVSKKSEINMKGSRFNSSELLSPHTVTLFLQKTMGGSKYQNAWGYFYMLSVLFTACYAILEDLKPLWPYGPSPCLGTGVLVAAQQHFETPEPPSAHGRYACVLCQHWTTELCDFNMLTYSCNWS